MHLYAKFDQNILYGLRVMTDGWTHIVIIVQTQGRAIAIRYKYVWHLIDLRLIELDHPDEMHHKTSD